MKKTALTVCITLLLSFATPVFANGLDLYYGVGEKVCKNKRQKVSLLSPVGSPLPEKWQIEKLLQRSELLCDIDTMTLQMMIIIKPEKEGLESLIKLRENAATEYKKELEDKGMTFTVCPIIKDSLLIEKPRSNRNGGKYAPNIPAPRKERPRQPNMP